MAAKIDNVGRAIGLTEITYGTRQSYGRFGPMTEETLNGGYLEANDFDTSHLSGRQREMADRINNEVFGPHISIWSGGGCRLWHVNDNGHLRMIYDGGDVYDYFSCDGEMAYYDSTTHYHLEEAVRAIAQDFGMEMEAYSGWATDFWPN